MSASSPAHSGATALVPPITVCCPSTTTLYPDSGSAFPATSGTPRPTKPFGAFGTFALDWYVGSANTSLTPPPVAPSFAESSFHTCSLPIALPEIANFVPPHATTNGLAAGKSTVGVPSVLPSDEPSSPAATSTVTPIVDASWHAEFSASRDCSVHELSGPPQLIEIIDGSSFASCTAVVTASINP